MIIGIDIDDTITDTYEVMMNYAQIIFIQNIYTTGKMVKI